MEHLGCIVINVLVIQQNVRRAVQHQHGTKAEQCSTPLIFLSSLSDHGGGLAVTMMDGSVLYQGVDGAWHTQRNTAAYVRTQPCSNSQWKEGTMPFITSRCSWFCTDPAANAEDTTCPVSNSLGLVCRCTKCTAEPRSGAIDFSSNVNSYTRTPGHLYDNAVGSNMIIDLQLIKEFL